MVKAIWISVLLPQVNRGFPYKTKPPCRTRLAILMTPPGVIRLGVR
jgi:hypothetical protein